MRGRVAPTGGRRCRDPTGWPKPSHSRTPLLGPRAAPPAEGLPAAHPRWTALPNGDGWEAPAPGPASPSGAAALPKVPGGGSPSSGPRRRGAKSPSSALRGWKTLQAGPWTSRSGSRQRCASGASWIASRLPGGLHRGSRERTPPAGPPVGWNSPRIRTFPPPAVGGPGAETRPDPRRSGTGGPVRGSAGGADRSRSRARAVKAGGTVRGAAGECERSSRGPDAAKVKEGGPRARGSTGLRSGRWLETSSDGVLLHFGTASPTRVGAALPPSG